MLGTRDQDEAIRMVLQVRDLRTDGDRGIREWAQVYADEMVRTGAHRQLTTSGVRRALTALCDWMGNRDVRTLTREGARDFHQSIQTPERSAATTHRYIRYTRAFFSWLMERRLASENPFSKMRIPAPRQSKRDRFCTAEERDRMLTECPGDELRGVLLLGFYCGMRINEIVNARMEWFTRTANGGFCTVRNVADGFTTKTGKERQIPLHSKVADYLRGLPHKKGFVIRPEQEQGKSWLRWNPRKQFTTLVKACGMPWVTFHTMRHTFGSLHAIAGTAELKIRRWMGITVDTWERHYAGLRPDDRDIEKI